MDTNAAMFAAAIFAKTRATEVQNIPGPRVSGVSQERCRTPRDLMASTAEQEAFHEMGVRRLSSEEVQMPSGRILTDSNTIDVMVLYTEASMIKSKKAGEKLMTTKQMETHITNEYAGVNDVFTDSGISASIRVVHMAKVRKPVCSFNT